MGISTNFNSIIPLECQQTLEADQGRSVFKNFICCDDNTELAA